MKIKRFINLIIYKIKRLFKKRYCDVYMRKSNSGKPFAKVGECSNFKIIYKEV